MEVSLKNHLHLGLQTGVEITITPPFVIPVILPVTSYPLIASVDDPTQPISLKDHTHELVELPSLGVSFMQRLGDSMATHSHIQEGISIETSGGVSISTVELFPPPLL